MVWDHSFKEVERKCIHDPFAHNQPLQNINELECIGQLIFANIWMEHRIAVIDYEKGKVVRWIDLSALQQFIANDGNYYEQTNRVLNGIAYNATSNTIYVTGKLWNRMFEIDLIDSPVFNKHPNAEWNKANP